MPNRCILIFPEFPNIAVIDSIRTRYDPAADLVRPHITLVFPFESELSSAVIRDHVYEALAGVEPFTVSLQGISAQRGFGNYLLLNVHTGKNTIKDIHRRLYTGILESFKPAWCRTYEPHLTVGRLDDPEAFARALDETNAMRDCFETCVREICVEIIGEDGSSFIESTFGLPV